MDVLECFEFTEALLSGLYLNAGLLAELFFECEYVEILLNYYEHCVIIKIPSFMGKIWTPPGTAAVGFDNEYIVAYNGFVRRYKWNDLDMYLMYNPEAKTREYYGFIDGNQAVFGIDNIITSVRSNGNVYTPFGYVTKLRNDIRLANIAEPWFHWPIYRKIKGTDIYGNKLDTMAFCDGNKIINNWIPDDRDAWFAVEKTTREEIMEICGKDLEMVLIPAPPARTDVVIHYASNMHQIVEKYFM